MSAPTVLLVTYNADERHLYGEALTGAGFDVLARSPIEALSVAVERPPAAIMTRIPQPGQSLDGVELTRAIKAGPTTARIPVIITSALSALQDVEAARASSIVWSAGDALGLTR